MRADGSNLIRHTDNDGDRPTRLCTLPLKRLSCPKPIRVTDTTSQARGRGCGAITRVYRAVPIRIHFYPSAHLSPARPCPEGRPLLHPNSADCRVLCKTIRCRLACCSSYKIERPVPKLLIRWFCLLPLTINSKILPRVLLHAVVGRQNSLISTVSRCRVV